MFINPVFLPLHYLVGTFEEATDQLFSSKVTSCFHKWYKN